MMTMKQRGVGLRTEKVPFGFGLPVPLRRLSWPNVDMPRQHNVWMPLRRGIQSNEYDEKLRKAIWRHSKTMFERRVFFISRDEN
jgi:hypothetical protein